MSKILCVAVATLIMGTMTGAVGCAKRCYYSNAFGQYTVSQAHKQYAELFQMEPREYEQFLTFENGWWKADVKKIRQMGVNIADVCERYCRSEDIKVPFPLLINYELVHGSG